MTEKAPAYQWYPKDILASQRVAEMSAEVECWYRRALDFCWVNGSLPADPERCARIIGKGCTEEGAQHVLEMFVFSRKDSSRKIHDRQEAERRKQAENRKKNSRAGKISAEKRKQQKELEAQQNGNGRSTDVATDEATKFNSSSSSSSSSSVLKREEANPTEILPEKTLKLESENGLSRHAAVAVYEEIFGPPRLELATSIAMTVKDLGIWHDLLTEKAGWPNPEKWIIKAYREKLAESHPIDPEKPVGKIKTAREINAECRAEEERKNREYELEKANANGIA